MKPLLLLDVDGVLLFQHSTSRWEVTPQGWINPRMKAELLKLEQEFEIVWCTGWGHMARTDIAPLFGCQDYPVLPITLAPEWKFAYAEAAVSAASGKEALESLPGNWKLASVEDWLDRFDGWQPVAWMDDEIGQPDVQEWAKLRPNTMLVHVDGERGVTSADLRRLHEFAYLHKPRTPFRAGLGLRERLHVRPAE